MLTEQQIQDYRAKYMKPAATTTGTDTEVKETGAQRLARIKKVTDMPEKPSTLSKIGNFVKQATVGSTLKFGKTTGEALAAPENAKKYDETLQQHTAIASNLRSKIGENKKLNKDTSKLESALQTHLKSTPKLEDFTGDVINKTTGQVLGEGLGTAVEMLSGGTLSGFGKGTGLLTKAGKTVEEAKKAKDAYRALSFTQKAASIGKDTAKLAATTVPFGYAVDVSQGLQGARGEDRTGGKAFIPGAGTAISAAIPAVVGTTRLAKAGVSELLPKIATNISGVPEGAYQQAKKGTVSQYIGKETPGSVLQDAKRSQELFKKSMGTNWEKSQADIIEQFKGKKIGLNDKESKTLATIADEFGFADRLPQNSKNMSAKETMDLIGEINAVGKATPMDSPKVRAFKFKLQDLKANIKGKSIESFGGEGGVFDKTYKEYAKSSKILKDINALINKNSLSEMTPVQKTTAQNRLMKLFNEDADAYYNAIKVLDDETASSPVKSLVQGHISEAQDVLANLPKQKIDELGGISSLLDRVKTNIVDGISAEGFTTEAQKIKNIDLSKISSLEQFNKIVDSIIPKPASLIDKVAAAHLSPILPKGLRGGPTGIIGFGSDILQLSTLPLSSPRMSNWLLAKASGYGPSVIDNIMNSSPVVRQNIYKLVSEKNMSLDDAIKQTWEKAKAIPNKQAGLDKIKVIIKQ